MNKKTKKKMLIATVLIIIAAVIVCYSLKEESYPQDYNYDIKTGKYANMGNQEVLTDDVAEATTALNTNHDTIRAWMQKDAKELTMAQIRALADTYLNLEKPEDIEWFINCGYKPYVKLSVMSWPEICYTETDTMTIVTRLVSESVSTMAFQTIWSDPRQYLDNEMINQNIERMQMLQIAEVLSKNSLSLFDKNPRIYEQVKSVSLGSPLMSDPSDAWRDKDTSIINNQNDGRISRAAAAKGLSHTYYYSLVCLGGKVCYTEVNGTVIIHGVDLYNPEVERRTMGYVKINDYGVATREEVIQIVFEGDENNPIYKDYLAYLYDGRYKG